jgi:peroxiredoxin
MIRFDRRRVLAVLAAGCLPTRIEAEPLPLVDLPGTVPAPDFALPDLSGTLHRLSDYRGRPVLVSFWAVWCPPCRRELADLSDLRSRLSGTAVEVFAVNLGDGRERIARFLADHPAPGLPVLLDDAERTAGAWHVRGLPVSYAVDPMGILRLGAFGERNWRAPVIERQLRSLI